jgi:hypothetical protein
MGSSITLRFLQGRLQRLYRKILDVLAEIAETILFCSANKLLGTTFVLRSSDSSLNALTRHDCDIYEH